MLEETETCLRVVILPDSLNAPTDELDIKHFPRLKTKIMSTYLWLFQCLFSQSCSVIFEFHDFSMISRCGMLRMLRCSKTENSIKNCWTYHISHSWQLHTFQHIFLETLLRPFLQTVISILFFQPLILKYCMKWIKSTSLKPLVFALWHQSYCAGCHKHLCHPAKGADASKCRAEIHTNVVKGYSWVSEQVTIRLVKSCLCLWPWTPCLQHAYCIDNKHPRNKRFCYLPQSSVFLHLHSAGKSSAFYCNKDIIDLRPGGGMKKWDWCPTERILLLGGGGGGSSSSKILKYSSPLFHTPQPTELLSHLPLFVSPSIIFLCTPREMRKKPQLQENEHTVRHEDDARVYKMSAFWDLHDCKKELAV